MDGFQLGYQPAVLPMTASKMPYLSWSTLHRPARPSPAPGQHKPLCQHVGLALHRLTEPGLDREFGITESANLAVCAAIMGRSAACRQLTPAVLLAGVFQRDGPGHGCPRSGMLAFAPHARHLLHVWPAAHASTCCSTDIAASARAECAAGRMRQQASGRSALAMLVRATRQGGALPGPPCRWARRCTGWDNRGFAFRRLRHGQPTCFHDYPLPHHPAPRHQGRAR